MDAQLIQNIFKYSQAYPFSPNVEPLLRKWEKNKARFIDAFDEKTIWVSKKPVHFEINDPNTFDDFREEISPLVLDAELYEFLVINQCGFFRNQVVRPWPKLNIKCGDKLNKSLKRFIPRLGKETIKEVQRIVCKYMQSNNVDGHLFLSVDPVDFLTASCNSSWRSCYALDGDYRAGTASYMVDKTTIIAYIAPLDKKSFRHLPPDVKWYDKKWRMFIHINKNNVVTFNKQYPFHIQEINEMVNKIINERIIKRDNRVLSRTLLSYVDDKKNLGYDDLAYDKRRSLYSTVGISKRDESRLNKKRNELNFFDKKFLSTRVGKSVPCVCCGIYNVSLSNSFICNYCLDIFADDIKDAFICCDGCGHRIYDYDERYKHGSETFCKSCYESYKRTYGDKRDRPASIFTLGRV